MSRFIDRVGDTLEKYENIEPLALDAGITTGELALAGRTFMESWEYSGSPDADDPKTAVGTAFVIGLGIGLILGGGLAPEVAPTPADPEAVEA